MTISIRLKVFLTLLLSSVLVVATMLGFMRWSFQEGLVELAESRQEERIEQVADRLTELYRRDGGWEKLRADKRLWIATLLGRSVPSARGRGFREDRAPYRQWLRHGLGSTSLWPPERVLRARLPDAPPPPSSSGSCCWM